MVTTTIAGLSAGAGIVRLIGYLQYADGSSSYIIKLAQRVMHRLPKETAQRKTVSLQKAIDREINSILPIAESLNPELKQKLLELRNTIDGYIILDFALQTHMRQARELQEKQWDYMAAFYEYVLVLSKNTALQGFQKTKESAANKQELQAIMSFVEQLNAGWGKIPNDVNNPVYVNPGSHLREMCANPNTSVQKDLETCLRMQECAQKTSAIAKSGLSVRAKSYLASTISHLNHYVPDYWPSEKMPLLNAQWGSRWFWWRGRPKKIIDEKLDELHHAWHVNGVLHAENTDRKISVDSYYFGYALDYLLFKLPRDQGLTQFIQETAGDGHKLVVFIAESVDKGVAEFFKKTHLDNSAVFCYNLSANKLICNEANSIVQHFTPYFSASGQKPKTTKDLLYALEQQKGRAFRKEEISFIAPEHLDSFLASNIKSGAIKEVMDGVFTAREI